MPQRSSLRFLLWPTLVAALALFTLVQFGNWQMRRLAWKESLIETVETRASQPPIALPPAADWAALRPEEYEYLPVRLTGRFLNDREAHVYTALSEPKGGPYAGPGYWVLTPLETGEGAFVIVNRGFVPLDAKDPAARAEGQVEGETEVTGLMRAPEAGNLFTPENDAAANQWFVRDPAAIAASERLETVAPFYVDAAASAPGGLPQGGETRMAFPNRHLEYAITWYGLALALALVYGAFTWQQLRRGRADPVGKP